MKRRVRVVGMYLVLRAYAHQHTWLSSCVVSVSDRQIAKVIDTLQCPSGIELVFINLTSVSIFLSHSISVSQPCIYVKVELDHDRSRSSSATYMYDLIVISTDVSQRTIFTIVDVEPQSNTFSDNRQRAQTSSCQRFPSFNAHNFIFTYFTNRKIKLI